MRLKHKVMITGLVASTVGAFPIGHYFDHKDYSFTQNFGAVKVPTDSELPIEVFGYRGNLKAIYESGLNELKDNGWFLDAENWSKGSVLMFRYEGEIATFDFDPKKANGGEGQCTWSIYRHQGWLGMGRKLQGSMERR